MLNLYLIYHLAIPQEVLEKLKPSKWKVKIITKWLQVVGLFDPEGKKWGGPGYILFVSLLYDSLGGLFKSVIPDKKWMLEHYGTNHSSMLPVLYILRFIDLLWRRTLNNK